MRIRSRGWRHGRHGSWYLQVGGFLIDVGWLSGNGRVWLFLWRVALTLDYTRNETNSSVTWTVRWGRKASLEDADTKGGTDE